MSTSVYICPCLSIYLYVCLYISMSVYISLCLSVYLYVCLYISMSVYIFDVCLYISMFLHVSLCLCISVCLYISMSVYIFPCLSIYLYVCLYIYMSVYISRYLSIYLHACLCISMSVYISPCLSMYLCLSINLHFCLCISMSVYISPCLSMYLYVYFCLQDIIQLFIDTEDCPECVNLMKASEGCWYVGFEDEDDTLLAFSFIHSDKIKINDNNLKVFILSAFIQSVIPSSEYTLFYSLVLFNLLHLLVSLLRFIPFCKLSFFSAALIMEICRVFGFLYDVLWVLLCRLQLKTKFFLLLPALKNKENNSNNNNSSCSCLQWSNMYSKPLPCRLCTCRPLLLLLCLYMLLECQQHLRCQLCLLCRYLPQLCLLLLRPCTLYPQCTFKYRPCPPLHPFSPLSYLTQPCIHCTCNRYSRCSKFSSSSCLHSSRMFYLRSSS